VLDIPVPQVGLQAAGIDALVRKREATGVPQHVGMDRETKAGHDAESGDQFAKAGGGERRAAFRRENER